jgi:oligoribonuclease (3'-5' exoribonuclease)
MKFVWVDLETSGIKASKCSICEIAAILTDESWEEQSVFTRVVDLREGWWEAGAMHMHMENGLLEDMKSDKAKSWAMVGSDFYKWLMSHAELDDEGKLKRFYLAGSSVHFDRRFLYDNSMNRKSFSFNNDIWNEKILPYVWEDIIIVIDEALDEV